MVRTPSKTFKMAKTTKRLLAGSQGSNTRGAFKNTMIDAQLASEVVIRVRERDNTEKK